MLPNRETLPLTSANVASFECVKLENCAAKEFCNTMRAVLIYLILTLAAAAEEAKAPQEPKRIPTLKCELACKPKEPGGLECKIGDRNPACKLLCDTVCTQQVGK